MHLRRQRRIRRLLMLVTVPACWRRTYFMRGGGAYRDGSHAERHEDERNQRHDSEDG